MFTTSSKHKQTFGFQLSRESLDGEKFHPKIVKNQMTMITLGTCKKLENIVLCNGINLIIYVYAMVMCVW